jgi:hypothetical protein
MDELDKKHGDVKIITKNCSRAKVRTKGITRVEILCNKKFFP